MMLMALLYSDDDRIVAAAPACDQVPYGDAFWLEFHEAMLSHSDFFETAYVTIANPELRTELLMLGIDQSLDGAELARKVEGCASPKYVPGRAA